MSKRRQPEITGLDSKYPVAASFRGRIELIYPDHGRQGDMFRGELRARRERLVNLIAGMSNLSR